MKAWAQSYADRGWPVFPLVPGHKEPLTKNGFKDATTNQTVIERWWDRTPTANIGAATGIAFSVLDIDGPQGETELSIYGDINTHAGPISYTGKGRHLFFLTSAFPTIHGRPGDLTKDPPQDAHWIPKVDYQNKGAYIVLPPSLHPNGQTYHWDASHGPDLALPSLPDWLADTMTVTSTEPQRAIKYRTDIFGNLTPVQSLYEATRPSIIQVAIDLDLKGRQVGSRVFMVPCIFHDDSTPSMALYLDTNTYWCHGCRTGGDSHQLSRRSVGYQR